MERHEKTVLFEPSTNQFGYVTRGYPITHATLKIGCKGSQWVLFVATLEKDGLRTLVNINPIHMVLRIGPCESMTNTYFRGEFNEDIKRTQRCGILRRGNNLGVFAL